MIILWGYTREIISIPHVLLWKHFNDQHALLSAGEREDAGWSRLLDDNVTEHPDCISLSVHHHGIDWVVEKLPTEIWSHGVWAQYIVNSVMVIFQHLHRFQSSSRLAGRRTWVGAAC
jgi:hypothetical protein